MGVSPVKKPLKTSEPPLPNGHDLKITENDLKITEHDQQASNLIQEKENNVGCCQGANGFSCCRDETPTTETEPEKDVNNAVSKFNILTADWTNYEVFTATAVIGVVVTIAVAYSFYKRLR